MPHPRNRRVATWLESVLTEQADTAEGLLRLPGAEQSGAEVFMHGWIDHLHQLTARARARRIRRRARQPSTVLNRPFGYATPEP